MPHDVIERRLGPTEDMYWRFDALSPLNFAVNARIRGALQQEQLRAAIDAVQLRHPLLRVRVQCDANHVPWFRHGAGPVQLSEREAGVDQTWAVLEQGLDTAIDSANGPMLRVELLRHGPSDATLQIVFHHAISDGRSAVFLLRDLLQSMAQQARGEAPWLEPLPPAGYYGDRIPALDRGGMKGLQTAWKTLKAAALFMEGAGLPVGLQTEAQRTARSDASRVFVEVRVLEGDALGRLVARAKRERTTVQCVLNAALSLSVVEDSPTGPMQRTGCTQVVDIRARLVPPVGEDCGCFATGITSLHSVDATTEFWSFAREIREHMDHSIATPLPFFHAAMHGVVTNVVHGLRLSNRKKFSEVMNSMHPEGLAVSNLGRVEVKVPGSPVEITGLAFATNTSVLNDLSTSAVTYGDRMTWAFNGSSILTRARIARIADRSMQLIADAVARP